MPEQMGYLRYIVEVSPSFYDTIFERGTNYYPYSTTHHLSPRPLTLKDLPDNRANKLKNIKVGDSIVFVCDPKRKGELTERGVKYGKELERKVTKIEYDPIQHINKVFFE